MLTIKKTLTLEVRSDMCGYYMHEKRGRNGVCVSAGDTEEYQTGSSGSSLSVCENKIS